MDRFWSKVDKSGGEDACWLWTANTPNGRYGQFTIRHGFKVAAHRFAYELANGEIPEGAIIMHACDTPACVNPRHLSAGTDAANKADMIRKRRQARKLTDADVERIREMLTNGIRQVDIADAFGINVSSVSRINTGAAWKHI